MAASGLQISKQLLISTYADSDSLALLGIFNLIASLFNNLGILGLGWFSISLISEWVHDGNVKKINDVQNILMSSYIYLSPLTFFIIFLVLGIKDNHLEYILYAFALVIFGVVNIPISQSDAYGYSKRQFIRAILGIITFYILLENDVQLLYILIVEALIILTYAINIKLLKLVSFKKVLFFLKKNIHTILQYSISIFLATLLVYLGRIFASINLDITDLGLFFFAFIIVSIGDQLQALMAIILQPIISELKYRSNDVDIGYKIFKLWILAIILSASIAVAIYLTFTSILYLFPKFSGSQFFLIPSLILMVVRGSNIWPMYLQLIGLPNILNKMQILTILFYSVGIVFLYIFVENSPMKLIESILIIEALSLFFAPFIILRIKS